MKPFSHYLVESAQKFEFKIKVANFEPDDDTLDHIERALKTYDLDSISKPKRLPIQSRTDFPNHGPIEVYVLDVVLNYPVNDAQLRQTLHDQAFLPLANIVVIPKNHPEELRRDEEAEIAEKNEGKTPEAILTQPLEDNGVKGEDHYGKKFTDSILKDLKSRKYEFAATEKDAGSTNELPQGNISPVGSLKGKK